MPPAMRKFSLDSVVRCQLTLLDYSKVCDWRNCSQIPQVEILEVYHVRSPPVPSRSFLLQPHSVTLAVFLYCLRPEHRWPPDWPGRGLQRRRDQWSERHFGE